MTFENLYNTLEQFAEVFAERYKDELRNKKASGALANSIKHSVNVSGGSYEVEITLLDYWKFVEDGRKAGSKFPPIDAIKEWIRIKKIEARPDAFGKLPTENQLSFLIARGIAEKGIPATNFFANSFDTTYSEFEEKIINSFAEDIGLSTKNLLSSLDEVLNISFHI